MSCLTETNPALVHAAFLALKEVDPDGVCLSRETEFTHEGQRFWAKIVIDPHANTIDEAWILPIDDPQVGRV